MKKCKHIVDILRLCAVTLVLCACGERAEVAQQAINEVSDEIAECSSDAARFLPLKLANVRIDQTELQFFFRNGDYATVLARAPAVLAAARKLNAEAAQKKGETLRELAVQWSAVDATMPPLVAAVRVRIERLAKEDHRSGDVDLAGAQADLKEAMTLWDRAESEFQGGDVEDALRTVKEARPKVEAAAAAIRMTESTDGIAG